MFAEKNLGNSVDDGVRDNGGMCLKAFLIKTGREKKQHSMQQLWKIQMTAKIIDIKNNN